MALQRFGIFLAQITVEAAGVVLDVLLQGVRDCPRIDHAITRERVVMCRFLSPMRKCLPAEHDRIEQERKHTETCAYA